MIKEELSQIIYDAWIADAELAGILHNEDGSPVHSDMLWALTDAISDGVLQAISSGGSVGVPAWRWDVLAGTGTAFTLSKTPLPNSLQVFRNGLLELGWTLAGTTLTLSSTRTSNDADLRAHYQYIEPT